MDFFTSTAIWGTISLFLFAYYYILFTKPRNNAPPQASGGWPLIGHLKLMGGTGANLPHLVLGSLADKYGPIFGIRLGVRRAIVVSDWEIAKDLFTTYDVYLSSRPKIRAANHMSYDNAMFGFTPYGEFWREMRKLLSVELLSVRRVEMLNHVRVSEINYFINDLYKLWKEKNEKGKVLVDLKEWLGELNLNVVMMMVAGKRFVRGDGASEETQRCRRLMRDFFYLTGKLVLGDAFPYLGWLDIGGFEKKMKENIKEYDQVVAGWLEDHRRRVDSGDANKAKDLMGVMLSVLQGAKFRGEYDVDTIIKATCESLIAGGTDTPAVTLVWAVSLVLNHPDVLRKAQEELDEHVGRERRVQESDISKLVYLEAICKETLRYLPAGPLGGLREFSKDCNIRGYHIPKGTWMIVNLWKMQRDPKVWSDPLVFKPERFLTEHKDIDVRGQHFQLLPFGAGRRICPGANFGIQILQLGLANLLQAFELSTVGDELVDLTEGAGLTNSKVTPLDVLLAPRLAPTLYQIA